MIVFHAAISLAREYSSRLIHQPRLAEQISREQLEIEADLAFPILRQRLVEIDRHPETVTFQRRDPNLVAEVEIGVIDRIETLSVFRIVRIVQCLADRIGGGIDHRLAVTGRHGRPLPR